MSPPPLALSSRKEVQMKIQITLDHGDVFITALLLGQLLT
jgi:hypothetical protein